MKFFRNISFAPFVLAIAGIAGCSTTPPSDTKAFAAPTQLTAKLVDPIDIELTWKNNASAKPGYFVEYSPEDNSQFDIIAALPPGATTYLHPHLLPHTRFVFRVVPFFGPASNIAEIKTGKEGPQQPPTAAEIADTNSPDAGIKKSLRSMATFVKAAPTDLRATLIPPAGVKLDWVDHASDADGYLLEIKPEWSRDFKVSAFLPPHTTTLTSYGFPPNTKFTFRVRAFFYGQPSNLAEQTTGNDPSLGPGTWIKSEPPSHP
ncbi:MAG TPA: fibronectin type III domain-containing protein [Verrucomicrobiae bacterium]|nr:fibronectin type III domain-containing protein [Verrucomicrobiae bacterium]